MPEFPVEVIIKLIDQVSSTTSQVKSSLASMDGSLKETERNTSSLQQAFTTAAGVMLRDFAQGAISGVQRTLKDASQDFRDFELTLTKTVGAAGVTGQAAEDLRSELVELSLGQTDLGYSATSASQALEALVKAGMDGEDAAKALRSALSLARLEGISTEKAAGLLVQTLTMFNLRAEDSEKALDAISRAADAGIGTADDYASGLSNCGAAANQMGMSLEDTLSALVVLDKTFGSATESGTYLNAMFKDIIAKSDDLGLSLYNTDGSMKGLDEIVQQLKKNVSAFGDDQQAVNEYLSTFDVRAQRAVTGLLNYDGSLTDVQKSMSDAYSVQQKVNDVMETGAGRMAELEAALENANQDLGEMTMELELAWKQFALGMGPIGGIVDSLGPTMLQGAITGVMMLLPQLIAKFTGQGGLNGALNTVTNSAGGLGGKLGGLNGISFAPLIAAIGGVAFSIGLAIEQADQLSASMKEWTGVEMPDWAKTLYTGQNMFGGGIGIKIGEYLSHDVLGIATPDETMQAAIKDVASQTSEKMKAGEFGSPEELSTYLKTLISDFGLTVEQHNTLVGYVVDELAGMQHWTSEQTAGFKEIAGLPGGEASVSPYVPVAPTIAPTIGQSATGFESTAGLISKMLARVPHMAEGGFVKEPTLALIGEAGPEVVLPVPSGDAGVQPVHNYNVHITIEGSVDDRVLRLMRKELESVLIESTSSSGKTKRVRRGGVF